MKAGVRVVGGALRSRRLAVLPGSRPTSERAREALFDILGPWIQRKSVLELYAGSGAVAIEALSRGASSVAAVDRDAAALEENRVRLGIAMEVIEAPAARAVEQFRRMGRAFDFVFLDPPYAAAAEAVRGEALARLLRHGGRLVWQTDSGEAPDAAGDGLEPERVAEYGRNTFSFFRKVE
ncbi:MAG: RsmD family RNA methyltransferase [Thermoanaerobaculia bacterium]